MDGASELWDSVGVGSTGLGIASLVQVWPFQAAAAITVGVVPVTMLVPTAKHESAVRHRTVLNAARLPGVDGPGTTTHATPFQR